MRLVLVEQADEIQVVLGEVSLAFSVMSEEHSNACFALVCAVRVNYEQSDEQLIETEVILVLGSEQIIQLYCHLHVSLWNQFVLARLMAFVSI